MEGSIAVEDHRDGRAALRRLGRNALIPLAANVGGRILDFGFALFYLRVLRDQVAAYQFLVIFVTYLDTLVNFGFNTILARDVARAPGTASAAFGSVARLRFGLWLLGLPTVAVVLGPAREAAGLPVEAVPAGWLFYLALLPGLVASTASGLLWAAERLEVPAAVSVTGTLLRILLAVPLLLLGTGLVGLAVTSLAVNVYNAIALLVALRRLRPSEGMEIGSGVAPVAGPRRLLSESWPLFVNQLLQGLFFRIDGTLLPGMAGARQASAYAAAYKVVDGAGVVSSSFTLALFPRLARDATERSEQLARAYRLGLRLLLQVGIPLAVGTALLAEPVAALVGGSGFLPDSAVALAILIWFLPLSYASGLTQYVLIAVGRQRFLTVAFLVAFVFNLGANLALIPRYGYVGAAWVTVLSELVLMVPFQWALRSAVPGVSVARESGKAILAAAVMAPVVWWLRDWIHPIAAVGAGAIVYPLALWAVGGIDGDEWAVARMLLPRRFAGSGDFAEAEPATQELASDIELTRPRN